MNQSHLPWHVHITHNKVPGRIRLRVHMLHRHPVNMENIRQSLLADLGEIVHSIEVNPATGSILIHHEPHESFMVQLALALERLGLEIALDDSVDSTGTANNPVCSLAMIATAHGINRLIDHFELCALHRVFFGVRVVAHLRRVFNNGLQLGPLATMLIDVGAEFGFLPAVLAFL